MGSASCANDVSYDIVDANGGNIVDINASTSPDVYSINENCSSVVATAANIVTRTVTMLGAPIITLVQLVLSALVGYYEASGVVCVYASDTPKNYVHGQLLCAY